MDANRHSEHVKTDNILTIMSKSVYLILCRYYLKYQECSALKLMLNDVKVIQTL